VTGVQTCALPICDKESRACAQQMRYSLLKESLDVALPLL
jgi:hypothetical protein